MDDIIRMALAWLPANRDLCIPSVDATLNRRSMLKGVYGHGPVVQAMGKAVAPLLRTDRSVVIRITF